jgi:hypothetical protein
MKWDWAFRRGDELTFVENFRILSVNLDSSRDFGCMTNPLPSFAACGGTRGIASLICDTSEVLPDKGLIIRGFPARKLANRLPEEILCLPCIGSRDPSASQPTNWFKENVKFL